MLEKLKTHRKVLILGAAALALIAGIVLAALQFSGPKPVEPKDVTIRGVTYSTTLEMSEYGGIHYGNIKVNTPNEDLILVTGNEADDKLIASFLKKVDTLIPGEYTLELEKSELHFIVDGMQEDDGSN